MTDAGAIIITSIISAAALLLAALIKLVPKGRNGCSDKEPSHSCPCADLQVLQAKYDMLQQSLEEAKSRTAETQRLARDDLLKLRNVVERMVESRT